MPAGPRKCPQCGAELPPNVPPERCPKCLLQAGLEAEAEKSAEETTPTEVAHGSADFLQGGQEFGHYRIIQPLGGGGMGTVFEAEDLDTDRRVALKVLSHSLDSPEARERFFREGRLAASINHPNSVYVFGTEEIGGTPVIAMELVPGGTLQQRVRERGPLPPAEAVDAALQILAGLEAAHRVGILHRDVKPSNCFVDPEGTVKIGDFGLSISTAIRTEPALTATGAFLGTPAFCPPEQLRGEELSVRSDIYALGATLYFLVTERTPFQAQNVVALIATVLEKRPPSPAKLQPKVPRGLASVVLRCLEKDPGERFKSYEELRQALAPYSSTVPAPATIGWRFVAGTVDMLLVGVAVEVLMMFDVLDPLDIIAILKQSPARALGLVAAGLALYLLYFALFEGLLGATPGKALCRLRVVGPDQNPPGVPRGLLRAALFTLVPVLPIWIFTWGDIQGFMAQSAVVQLLMNSVEYVIIALLFVTARRANGLAAVHDLVTRTRVITRLPLVNRPVSALPEATASAVGHAAQVGPYHVLETLGQAAGFEWLLGYDLRLLRHVWIRKAPPGTPSVPPQIRNIGRVGRLRWLTGRRSPEENWDAFEAPTGEPLLRKIRQKPQPWAEVRFWLQDLATELNTALKDGTVPEVLSLERVWISGEGRAKLLDFDLPGVLTGRGGAAEREGLRPVQPGEPPPTAESVPQFLKQVAAAALEGQEPLPEAALSIPPRAPLPLHAREFIRALPQLSGPGAVLEALRSILRRPALVSRRRRVAVLIGCLVVPLAFSILAVMGLGLTKKWQRANPGIMELNSILGSHRTIKLLGLTGRGPAEEQYAIYIAAHYAGIITNQEIWSGPFAQVMITGGDRHFAERSVAQNPAPTPEQIKQADAALKGIVTAAKPPSAGHLVGILFPGMLIAFVCLPALIAALLFRGGVVLRIASIAFVRRDGVPAGRWRVFWRAVVAWLPLLASLTIWIGISSKYSGSVQALGWLIASVLAVGSVLLPERGLPDRFAGTWPVPR